jgi:hypothetical protein
MAPTVLKFSPDKVQESDAMDYGAGATAPPDSYFICFAVHFTALISIFW